VNGYAVRTSTHLADDGTLRVTFQSGRVATVHLENAEPVRIHWRGARIWETGRPVSGPASIVGQVMAAVAEYKARSAA
jgi:hypothetical protein